MKFTPDARKFASAHVPNLEVYRKRYAASIADPEGFWSAEARMRILRRCVATTS